MSEYSESSSEPVKPLSSFYSTSLSPRVTSYDTLATRIAYALGYPLVNVEVHTNAVYDNISVACEMYAKFAGYTEEFLVFDSDLYEPGKGVKMDRLFSITPDLTECYDTGKRELTTECCPEDTETEKITGHEITCTVTLTSTTGAPVTGTSVTCVTGDEYELDTKIEDLVSEQLANLGLTTTDELCGTTTDELCGTTTDELCGTTTDELCGTVEMEDSTGTKVTCTTAITAEPLVTTTGTATECLTSVTTKDKEVTTTTTPCSANKCLYNVSYDYDLNDYRKVIDVWSFTQGTHTGVNTLFTLEQSLAQQTYFSYAMGNYGFDLVSWYAVKEWLELREKLLCTKPAILFNDKTQYMKLVPEPRHRYYGIVACYVEAPVKDLVKNIWVYQYALALTKMTVGRVRGKFTGTNLIGGGNLDGDSLVQEGKEEKERLETELYENAPGLGDSAPPQFFVA